MKRVIKELKEYSREDEKLKCLLSSILLFILMIIISIIAMIFGG